MHIDWSALGQVFGVSVVVTVAVVGLFTLGIVGTARRPQAVEAGSDGTTAAAGSVSTSTSTSPTVGARAGAYACFALCAAAVAYGIWIIVAG
ncbi:hypothetical protein AB0M28_21755 [Streptomyces sp. NPDC051940]|uniref:hypothetical protein n=1 Tax=Streptomyces sp. NPDC051940 TaxID=3155675 RepID=UPI0034162642